LSSLPPPERLRPGRHQLTREDVTRSQRERLLVAMLLSVGEFGYAATTVADVVSRAAVSRTTFYGQFADKEACFLAAYDFAMRHALSQLDEATQGRPAESWQERVRGDLGSYLQVLMAEPALAVTLHLEVLAAGPAALEHRVELLSVLASRIANLNQLAQQRDGAVRELPAALFALYTGGLDELIRDRLRTGQVQGLQDLADPLVEATCAMFGA
jgi:AcrR family transcriptional regulator